MGEFADNFDLIFDQSLAQFLFIEAVVDDLDTDGLLVAVRGLEDLGSVALSDFALAIETLPVYLDLPHSSF